MFHFITLKITAQHSNKIIPILLLTAVLFLPLLFSPLAFSKGMEISCRGAPADAVTVIPPLFTPYATLKCTIYGHLITFKKGALWTYPGSYSPVRIPAQMVRTNPKVVNHTMYFKSITARTVKGDEAKKIYAPVTSLFDSTPGETPSIVLELTATSHENKKQILYLIPMGDSMLGYTCQTSCKPESPFIVLKK